MRSMRALLLTLVVVTGWTIQRPLKSEGADDQQAVRPDVPKAKRSVELIQRDRRNVTQGISTLLEDGEAEKVADQFNKELLESLSKEKWKSLWNELETSHGRLRRARTTQAREVGILELATIELRFEKATLELRFDFDNDRISGIWIDVPPGKKIDGIPEGGYAHGVRIQRMLDWKCQAEIKVLDPTGEPSKQCRVWAYHLVAPDDAPKFNDWVEPAGERRWRSFSDLSGTDSVTVSNLVPGWYRALAWSNETSPSPAGLSEPFQIDESNRQVSTTIRVQPGGTLRATVKPADDGVDLKDARTVLVRADHAWPESHWPCKKEGNLVVYEFVPAGRYKLTAFQRAADVEGLEYKSTDEGEFQIANGETLELALIMKGRPLTEAEKNLRAPWMAKGRVTDLNGNPIAGATIRASAGWGSLFSSVIATTDGEGRYQGRFSSTGIRLIHEWDEDPLDVVSAQVGASKEGLFESSLNRIGGMRAASRHPRTDDKLPEYADPGRLFFPGEPREINFVMQPAAELVVQFLGEDGKPLSHRDVNLTGPVLPPACSVIESGKTNAEGQLVLNDIPVDYVWWFQVHLEGRKSLKSAPFKLPKAATYTFTLKQIVEELTGYDKLTLVSATDSAGQSIMSEVAIDDKLTRPPVDAARQEQGRGLLKKIREANRFWLIGPAAEVQSYSYDFALLGQKPQSFTVADPSKSPIYQRRGISYLSALDYVTSNPENVIFRAVDVGDESIELAYALKEVARVSAGNGVAQTWRGFFSMPVLEGILVVDARTMTVKEHRSGHHVPLRIQINKMKLDWTFKVHQPGLWLFDSSAGDSTDGVRMAEVKNVTIRPRP